MSSWPTVTAPAAHGEHNILVTRFKSIGDVLFTLPAIHALREQFPTARITALTSKENESLFQGFADINDIISIDRAAYHRGRLGVITCEMFSLLRRFRREKFSLAIDFQGYGETAILTWLTRAPQRWGSVYRTGRGWAYTRGVRRDIGIHQADWNLSMLRQCGVTVKSVRNEFILPETVLREARAVFTRLQLDADRPALFIQPFTSSPNKTWPLDNFLALANHWRNEGVQVLFGGGPQDRVALEPAHRAGFAVSAGTSLLVSAGLTKLCTIVVGGDTGLLHLAVALNKRVVCVAHTKHTAPYQHADWSITPSNGADMSGISIGAVIDACAHAFAAENAFEPALV